MSKDHLYTTAVINQDFLDFKKDQFVSVRFLLSHDGLRFFQIWHSLKHRSVNDSPCAVPHTMLDNFVI